MSRAQQWKMLLSRVWGVSRGSSWALRVTFLVLATWVAGAAALVLLDRQVESEYLRLGLGPAMEQAAQAAGALRYQMGLGRSPAQALKAIRRQGWLDPAGDGERIWVEDERGRILADSQPARTRSASRPAAPRTIAKRWKIGPVRWQVVLASPGVPRLRRQARGMLLEMVLDGVPLFAALMLVSILAVRSVESSAIARLQEANAGLEARVRQRTSVLERSQRRYRALYHLTPAMLCSLDREGCIRNVSRQWLRTLGQREEEVLGRDWLEFLTAESARYAREVLLPRFWKTGRATDVPLELLRADGTVVEVRLSAVVECDEGEECPSALVVLTNVSEEKGMARRLEESGRRYWELVNATGEGILALDGSSHAGLFANRALASMLGYTRLDLVGMRPEELFDPRVVPEVQALLRLETTLGRDLPVRRRDGSLLYTDVTTGRIVMEGKECMMLFLRDVSERWTRAQQLRRSEARYRNLVETAHDAILLTDREGNIVEVNCRSQELTGYSQEELRGMSLLEDLVVEEDRQRLRQALASPEGCSPVLEVRWRAKDGSLLHLEGAGARLDPGSLVHFAWRDITERRRLEEQLLQAQKMEAVGMLAGGIAHDFNNLLTGLIGFTDLLEKEVCSQQGAEDVREIRALAERASRLTRQLLAFSRRQPWNPTWVSLNRLIGRMTEMLKRIVGTGLEVDFEPHADPDTVRADPTQLEQVIVNLAINARDAMGGSGRLEIRTANVGPGQATSSVGLQAPTGPAVALSVSDQGGGMSRETLSRIFEPFFTTKDPGQGTGLGLSTVYGIVSRHGGSLDVESRPGRGTRFVIYLPLEGRPDSGPPHGSQRELPGGARAQAARS